MSGYEVPEPILNSPFEEPREHWRIGEGELPRREPGRRPAMYYYRPPTTGGEFDPNGNVGIAVELKLVNRIRERLKEWRGQGCPGATRTTLELLQLLAARRAAAPPVLRAVGGGRDHHFSHGSPHRLLAGYLHPLR